MMALRVYLRVCLIVLFACVSAAAQVNVRLVTDEAEAVLSVLVAQTSVRVGTRTSQTSTTI